MRKRSSKRSSRRRTSKRSVLRPNYASFRSELPDDPKDQAIALFLGAEENATRAMKVLGHARGNVVMQTLRTALSQRDHGMEVASKNALASDPEISDASARAERVVDELLRKIGAVLDG